MHCFPQVLRRAKHRRVSFIFRVSFTSRSMFKEKFKISETNIAMMHRFCNFFRCLRCLQQVKQEYLLVKAKLESLLRVRAMQIYSDTSHFYFYFLFTFSFFPSTFCSWSNRLWQLVELFPF